MGDSRSRSMASRIVGSIASGSTTSTSSSRRATQDAERIRERSAKVAHTPADRVRTRTTPRAAGRPERSARGDPGRTHQLGVRHEVRAADRGADLGGIDRWGDYHFARGLQRSLERAGHPTRVHFLPDWTSTDGGARRHRRPRLRAQGGADPSRPGQHPVADQPSGSGHAGDLRTLRPRLRGVGPVRRA